VLLTGAGDVECRAGSEVPGTATAPGTAADEVVWGGTATGGVAAGGDTLTVVVSTTPLTTVVTTEGKDADDWPAPGEGGLATSPMASTVTATSTGRAYARQP
jgi:hypothetical protein